MLVVCQQAIFDEYFCSRIGVTSKLNSQCDLSTARFDGIFRRVVARWTVGGMNMLN